MVLRVRVPSVLHFDCVRVPFLPPVVTEYGPLTDSCRRRPERRILFGVPASGPVDSVLPRVDILMEPAACRAIALQLHGDGWSSAVIRAQTTAEDGGLQSKQGPSID